MSEGHDARDGALAKHLGALAADLPRARALGDTLRRAGLHPRALAAWAGSERVPLVAARRGELAARPVTPASAALALCVAGADVPRDRLPRDVLDPALVEGVPADRDLQGDAHRPTALVDGNVRARVAIVPVGPSLVACDRADRAAADDLVCWPDDSSYHLAAAIPPGRRDTWLDLGCGSAFAALARPELARTIIGTELNPRAAAHARLGAALSGVAHLEIREGDLAAPAPGRFQLVTCNAPIPAITGPIWRATSADFVARLVAAAAGAVERDGLVVIHAALDALEPALRDRSGERVVVAYTPPEAARQFAVAWWRPDAASRLGVTRRALTTERPHLTFEDHSIVAK